MSAQTGLPSAAGICRVCGRETGNLARHTPACRARAAASLADARVVGRAAAHALPEDALEPAQRFQGAVTDLRVARLLRALDEGVSVVQGGRYGWIAPDGSPLSQPRLAAVVAEALRTGLARAVSTPVAPGIRQVRLVPAPVHLRAPTDAYRPSCRPLRVTGSPTRYRIVDDRDWVDCQACLDAAY